MKRGRGRLPLLAPEVVQTSAMDCGPAALKCLLEGFGVSASYGRLREACQTDVDGTSIDTLEEVALSLGLEAEQVMLPVDHVLRSEGGVLPALAVVRLGTGMTHFVVLWRRHGRLVQVMDPAVGRRFTGMAQQEAELYVHREVVPAAQWREFAGTPAFLEPLSGRLEELGVRARDALDEACADPGWKSLAAVDAATRLCAALVRAGGVRRGAEARKVIETLWTSARDESPSDSPAIPPGLWFARELEDEPDQLLLRGAVLVRFRGLRATGETPPPESLSPELAAALREPPSRPWRTLFSLLSLDGWVVPGVLAGLLGLAAAGVATEAVLLRGLLELGRELGLVEQRAGALAALLLFLTALLGLDLLSAVGMLRVGRRLELRLRMAFLQKIPRLENAYLHSRLKSDMAQRSHSIHLLRLLPRTVGGMVHTTTSLVLTAVGIAWLDPGAAGLAALAAASALAVPLFAARWMIERDLRLRTHAGGLGRFYLDALLGLVPIRAHGAQRAMRSQHDSLLRDWADAGIAVEHAGVWADAIQALVGGGFAVWIFFDHIARVGESGGVLLLLYWALALPLLGQELATLARQYPAQRNVALRLLEPLQAPEAERVATPASPGVGGVSLRFEGVSVRAAGHTILRDIDLEIRAGEHVAVVGPSGAGKSTLVGLLLGWHRPARGSLSVDGSPMDPAVLEWLRRATVWVDPAVQLWNRSVLQNLCYGATGDPVERAREAVDSAELRGILERLPEGLQTPLGEGGGLVSGGEGQRVRFGRALVRGPARLVVMDEPFRGLGRDARHRLLAESRRRWASATLVCITHEISETAGFSRVVVVDHGRVVESGRPGELAARESRYRRLLEAEGRADEAVWRDPRWRRLQLAGQRVVESPEGGA